MQIQTGSNYVLVNRVTKEWTHYTPHEIYDYKGAYIVAGSASAHQIWLPSTRGRVSVPARASTIVVVRDQPDAVISAMVDKLKGIPWVLTDKPNAASGIPVLNMRRLKGFGQSGDDNNARVDRASRLVDLFWHYQETDGGLTPDYTQALLLDRQQPPEPKPDMMRVLYPLGGYLSDGKGLVKELRNNGG